MGEAGGVSGGGGGGAALACLLERMVLMFASEWWLYAVPLGWKIRRHDSGRAATDGSALAFQCVVKIRGGLLVCCNAISLADVRDWCIENRLWEAVVVARGGPFTAVPRATRTN